MRSSSMTNEITIEQVNYLNRPFLSLSCIVPHDESEVSCIVLLRKLGFIHTAVSTKVVQKKHKSVRDNAER